MLSLVMTYSLLYKVAPLLPPPSPLFFPFPCGLHTSSAHIFRALYFIKLHNIFED